MRETGFIAVNFLHLDIAIIFVFTGISQDFLFLLESFLENFLTFFGFLAADSFTEVSSVAAGFLLAFLALLDSQLDLYIAK